MFNNEHKGNMWGCNTVVDCLPRMGEALSLAPSIAKLNNKQTDTHNFGTGAEQSTSENEMCSCVMCSPAFASEDPEARMGSSHTGNRQGCTRLWVRHGWVSATGSSLWSSPSLNPVLCTWPLGAGEKQEPFAKPHLRGWSQLITCGWSRSNAFLKLELTLSATLMYWIAPVLPCQPRQQLDNGVALSWP